MVMAARGGRPLLLIDLAVPRDIEPDCGELPGVTLLDIDGLQAPVRAHTCACARPRRARAEAIVEEEIQALRAAGSGTLEVLPTIAALRAHGDEIVEQAAGRERGPLGGAVASATASASRRWPRAVVKRLLHEPTRARASALDAEHRHARLQLLRELFGLDDAGGRGRAERARRGPRAAPAVDARCGSARAAARWRSRRRARWRRLLGGADRARRRSRPPATSAARAATSRAGSARSSARCWPATIDLAVHSAKDVPGRAAPTGPRSWPRRARADPRDVLVRRARRSTTLRAGRAGGDERAAPPRAAARACGPTSSVVELRGNVDTRLRKLAAGEVDALVLAAAGLDAARPRATRRGAPLERVFVPAAGPGRARVQARAGERRRAAAAIDDAGARRGAGRRARAGARARAPTATRRSACSTRHGARARRSSGCPTASEWLVDERATGATSSRRAARRARRPAPRDLLRAGAARRWRVTVVPRRRRARRPGPADRARGRADRARRRDPLRPADPARGARRARGPDAELVYVGKEGGGPQMPAGRRSTGCCSSTRAPGRRVVRLKGGDPFVFGRGGEEALVLPRGRASRSRSCPGVTAGRRRARLRRHPGHAPRAGQRRRVRHRPRGPGQARDRRSTGRRSPRFPGTLVFYMGVRALPRIAERLIAGGPAAGRAGRGRRARHAARPAHAARDARPTSPSARRRSRSARRRSRSSAPVAALREQLAWLEARPLHGRTRRGHARAGAGERARGAAARRSAPTVVEAPAIRIAPLRRAAAADSRGYDLVVRDLAQRRRRAVRPPARRARRWPASRVAAIGPGTARGAARARDRARRRARARGRRGARRGAGGRRRSRAR